MSKNKISKDDIILSRMLLDGVIREIENPKMAQHIMLQSLKRLLLMMEETIRSGEVPYILEKLLEMEKKKKIPEILNQLDPNLFKME
jgi:hypothetical protein